jgi:thiol:disulfide interchange protein DsbD
MNQWFGRLFALLLGVILPTAVLAQSGALPDAIPKVNATLVAEHAGVTPGGTVAVALNEVIRKEWHTYWVNPGDSGAPTIINWHLPAGWTAAPIQWPYPKRLPVGPLMNFGYEDQVALISDVTAPADAKPGDTATLSADVMWLVCSDVCIPEETHLSLAPAGDRRCAAARRQECRAVCASAREAAARFALGEPFMTPATSALRC